MYLGVQRMARMTWQYLAGLFDGEGNLHTTRAGAFRLTISQSRPRGQRLMEDVRAFLQDQQIIARISHIRYKQATMHYLYLNRPGIQQAGPQLLPFLRIKKVEMQDMLRFLQIYPRRH